MQKGFALSYELYPILEVYDYPITIVSEIGMYENGKCGYMDIFLM